MKKIVSVLLIIILSLSVCITAGAVEKRGIDVSVWQGNIDWNKVKNSGIDFAMIRSGFGRDEPRQVDPEFYNYVNGAKNAGINVGVYHYSYAESPQDAVNEANFCLKIIKGNKYEYPIALDIEDDSMLRLGNRQLTEICKSFCDTIRNAGYYPIVYTYLNWTNTHLYSDELFPKYDLWLAQWYKTHSRDCQIWQYCSDGYVDGINGRVDCNICYKDYPSIIKNAHLNGY